MTAVSPVPLVVYGYGTLVLGVSATPATVPCPCGFVPYIAGVFALPLPERGA
jgi:hypothetical protein